MNVQKLTKIIISTVIAFLHSCHEVTENSVQDNVAPSSEKVEMTKSDSILNDAIQAHGGDLYETAHYSFTFREKVYTFKNHGSNCAYTSEYQTDLGWQKDVLENGKFTRYLDNESQDLSEENSAKYGASLNSVIYFATIPHKLSDTSVNSEYLGTVKIDSFSYEAVKVTFSEEGGGQDYQDEYMYWINAETAQIDYFAYNYQVNEGGVRFRSAFNARNVDGIIFQDYRNYSAEVGTPLEDLPALFELDSLPEVSRIELVDVKKL